MTPIAVTNPQGKIVYVNADHITLVRLATSMDSEGAKTVLHLSSGANQSVQEHIHEVIARIP